MQEYDKAYICLLSAPYTHYVLLVADKLRKSLYENPSILLAKLTYSKYYQT